MPSGARGHDDVLARLDRALPYEGDAHEAVHRSLIVLKALTFAPTGGIVAAPTTSLPEQIGGVRNWDYRFCWVRDATLTLDALLAAGYAEEADAVARLASASGGRQSPRTCRSCTASPANGASLELELAGSRATRVRRRCASETRATSSSNSTSTASSWTRSTRRARSACEASEHVWSLQRVLLRHLERRWREPDHGIWEIRGEPQHFVHSKVMAWVAFDRAVQAIEEYGLKGDLERWRAMRDEIHAEVCREGFDDELGSFTQFYGSGTLDASLLLIPLVGFLPPRRSARSRHDRGGSRATSTWDGLVLRYRSEEDVDGLPGGEGVFLPCSFWLVDCLELIGDHEPPMRCSTGCSGCATTSV